MADTIVLVHGAWHTEREMEPVASHLRALGYNVCCPTLTGNREGDDRATVGLLDATSSLADFIRGQKLERFRLVAHSYGGMVISGIAHEFQSQIQRIVYCNAFVPLPGESLMDLVPEAHRRLFEAIAADNQNSLKLPFEVWRDVFISDADFPLATASYGRLNAQPYNTFTQAIALDTPLAQLDIPKSYVNCQQDVAMPHSMPWHPRLSERLGLFRLVECAGSHEVLFTDPLRWAEAIHLAARD
jgi:pimeloyl-ACP methyl ester carboxylesterase